MIQFCFYPTTDSISVSLHTVFISLLKILLMQLLLPYNISRPFSSWLYSMELLLTGHLYQFPALHNKSSQTQWLKTIEMSFLTVLKPKVQNQGIGRTTLPLKTLGEELLFLPFFFLSSFFLPFLPPSLSWDASPQSLPPPYWSLSCVYLAFLCHLRICTLGFRTHPVNSG